jgi:hypothetical protein
MGGKKLKKVKKTISMNGRIERNFSLDSPKCKHAWET